MKKIILDKAIENSVQGVLGRIAQEYRQIVADRKFDPNVEVFDFKIEQKDGESRKKFYRRQEKKIKEFVEDNLWFMKRGERQKIKLIRKHTQLLADLFYQRIDLKTKEAIQSGIIWANRGGGKSLIAAILIFLGMVWRKQSFSDLAGSAEQALEVYGYVSEFWNCIPVVKEKLLLGEPLQTKTQLKNGVSLKCIANSANQARGKHPEGFIADEVCQKDRYKDDNVLQATNSVLTQEDFIVLYLSTFHLPTGIFAETWDYAEALGFKRYKWNIFDCMKRCNLDIDCHDCKLTRKKVKRDAEGRIVETKYFGCNGKARKSDGWLSLKQVLKIKKKSLIHGYNWRTEFECKRPETAGRVYKTKKVRGSLKNRVIVPIKAQRSVGIDFGTSKQCVITLVIKSDTHVIVPYCDVSVGRDLDYIVEILKAIQVRFGEFIVFGDAEQSYGILYLRKAGFTVEKVAFNKWKDLGIQNVDRYFNTNKLKILNNRANRILWRQLIGYKRDEHGKPIKKDDHGPDSLMCAMLRFDFLVYFGRAIAKEAAEDMLDNKNSDVSIF